MSRMGVGRTWVRPVSASALSRAYLIGGFGPISFASALLATTSMTRLFSKYTVKDGYTQRLMVGHWRFCPPRGSSFSAGAPNRASTWAIVWPRAGMADLFSSSTLLIERVQEEPGNLPRRGMSMAQVEARFGAPSDRLDPRGGQKRQWPTINRWTYPAFTVYFERTRVIDVVMTKSDPNEIGPKPPTP